MGRTKKSIKNIIFAFGLQLVKTVLNFAYRTYMIKILGMQAVSVNGLFTEVLTALSLAELGVGSAIVYNLYKPLASGDREKVCQLMWLFKKAYRYIALGTFLLGIFITPWITYLVNSVDYSDAYVRLVFLLFVVNLSVSYLFTYKISLISADQKSYVQNGLNIWISVAKFLVQILIMLIFKNYIFLLISTIALTVIGNWIISARVDKYYPWLKDSNDPLPKSERQEVFSNIKNLFIKTLSGKITNSTDNMLISALVSTMLVGYYTNYALVFGVFRQIANQIAYSGISAGLGNLLATESSEKSIRVYYRLLYLFYIVGAIGCVGIYCCIKPFILIWLKSEEFLLPGDITFVCCMVMFLEILCRPMWAMMEVSGLFRQDKYVSIAGTIINLVISIVFGLKYGMIGIFIGTIATYLVQATLKGMLLFNVKFGFSPKKYYLLISIAILSVIAQAYLANTVCGFITVSNKFIELMVNGIVSCVVVGVTTLLFTYRTDSFKYYKGLIFHKIKQ